MPEELPMDLPEDGEAEMQQEIEITEAMLPNSSYTLRMFVSGCRYWSEELEEWDTAGCQVIASYGHTDIHGWKKSKNSVRVSLF